METHYVVRLMDVEVPTYIHYFGAYSRELKLTTDLLEAYATEVLADAESLAAKLNDAGYIAEVKAVEGKLISQLLKTE